MSTPSTVHLEEQLKQLHLAALLRQYRPQAQAATEGGWLYEAYLADLIQQEVDRRSRNRRQRRIKEAHFPLLKELADFDFAAIPQLNRQKVMELAQGHYLDQVESVLLVGNPGRQVRRVRSRIHPRPRVDGAEPYRDSGAVGGLPEHPATR